MACSVKRYALLLSESVGEKPNTTASAAYTGSQITNGYNCPAGVVMTGNDRGTAGGVYTATYTPDEWHEWSDGTRDTVTVTLTISYVWQKWNIKTLYAENTESVRVPTSASRDETFAGSGKKYIYSVYGNSADAYTFDQNTGKYVISGSNGHWTTLDNIGTQYSVSTGSYTVLGIPSEDQVNSFDGIIKYTTSNLQAKATRNANNSVVTVRNIDDMNQYSYEKRNAVVSSRSKGTTRYADVSDVNNISAYPENGIQGDYWYVKTW